MSRNLVLFIISLMLFIIPPIVSYSLYVYPLDRDVMTHIRLAMTVNDAEIIHRELQYAYEGLKNFHGNPVWLFPTSETDFDYIRMLLGDQLNATKKFINVDSNDYGYQRFLKNVYYANEKVLTFLETTTFWLVYNPIVTLLSLIGLAIFIYLMFLYTV